MRFNVDLKGQQVGIHEENDDVLLTINVNQKNSSEELLVPVVIKRKKWEEYLKKGLDLTYIQLSGNLLSTWQNYNLDYKLQAEFIGGFETSLFNHLGGECNFRGYATIEKKRNFDSPAETENKLHGQKILLKSESNVLFETVAMRERSGLFDSFNVGDKIFVVASLMPGSKNRPWPYFAVRSVTT